MAEIEEAEAVIETVKEVVEEVAAVVKPDEKPAPQKSQLAESIAKQQPVEKSILNGGTPAQNLADMTMDTVKDYLNGDGHVTVHTEESSTIKKTVVKDGDIVTTVHEQELKDGKVIKDDVVNVNLSSAQEQEA
ncbi:hypothetical protein Ciccas_004678 [Cichlidogyrus casuarinus]|uniref:Uncharacterized protein n=1 Tax=Cichlidogyrus casuarinus TaxID=1844966 RepID=A0ABD2QD32_9PLAT